ncbi:hypothetical protein FDI24_gp061 [Acidovorax phage ACP17]|uniref:Uncharacterized protein n=1 Tax=Acidovorax phage ACP17 TaxID=2010329 RepID=A0A223AIY7_9CAUD|nr:hypothetical protein FDI24_gp061 [Acidovorax phage ACP17]ASS33926.1 hypothetical protein [Acidovorax phage ACP17]
MEVIDYTQDLANSLGTHSWLLQFCDPSDNLRDDGNFYIARKPMRVFKKTGYIDKPAGRRHYRYVLVELEIPAGTVVYGGLPCAWENLGIASECRKMRAAQAKVVRQFYSECYLPHEPGALRVIMEQNGQSEGLTLEALYWLRPFDKRASESLWRPSFEYRNGEILTPDFSWNRRQCAAGIHFFISPMDALDYCL